MRRPSPRPALALGAAALAAVAIGAGYVEQDRYLERRYADVFDGLRLDTAIAWANPVAGREHRHRRPRRRLLPVRLLRRRTSRTRSSGWASPGPRGAWLPLETCEEWREAVDEGGYDYVVTTYDRRFPGLDQTSREREWIRRDPAARRSFARAR